jgi:hypothetical protein
MMKQITAFFKSCRPVFSFHPVTQQPQIALDIQPQNIEASLQEIFEYLKHSEARCYIAIDEFQQITEYPEKGVEALLRSYMQFLPNVKFIFAGSKKHLMDAIFSSANRPFYQSTQKIGLHPIAIETYRDFAQNIFKNAQREIEKSIFVEDNLIIYRGKQVLLDTDVAVIYGVETKHVNQAIKNNPHKFPDGYVIKLEKEEWVNLKSKFLTSSWGGKRKEPTVITEKGLYMIATILKSPDAAEATIAIIETFAKLRELARNIERLNDETIPEKESKTLTEKTGKMFKEIFNDPLPVKMRKVLVSVNFGVFKISVETVRAKENLKEISDF